MSARLVFVHAWTPLHAGTGQGVGSIDLPIARERATGLPLVPGSSIKGCLRDNSAFDKDDKIAIFGPETTKASDHAGALRVGDARLTLLPVRSLSATFVWVTCPFVLRRLKRDAEAVGVKDLPKTIPPVTGNNAGVTAKTNVVIFKTEKRLVLEELDLKVEPAADTETWANWFAKSLFAGDPAWQGEFEKRFAIVSDEVFTFLAEFATEVNAHISINDETGTVDSDRGALWYQECLPAESILCSCFQADRSRKPGPDAMSADRVLDRVAEVKSMQLGGKASTGLGVVRLAFVSGAKG